MERKEGGWWETEGCLREGREWVEGRGPGEEEGEAEEETFGVREEGKGERLKRTWEVEREGEEEEEAGGGVEKVWRWEEGGREAGEGVE